MPEGGLKHVCINIFESIERIGWMMGDPTYLKKTVIKKESLDIPEEDDIHWCEVEYGIRYLEGNKCSYVFVTADGYDGSRFGGTCSDIVRKYAEHLNDIVDLHLVGADGVPMHYLDNARYHWKIARGESQWSLQYGRTQKDHANYYRSVVCAGVLPDDDEHLPQPEDLSSSWEDAEVYLKQRLPMLKEHVQKTLERYLGDELYS